MRRRRTEAEGQGRLEDLLNPPVPAEPAKPAKPPKRRVMRTVWEQKYRAWIERNPQVLDVADRVVRDSIREHRQLSSGSIMHILRWYAPKDWESDGGFRVNQNFGAAMIRHMVTRHPDLKVETRPLRSKLVEVKDADDADGGQGT